MEKCLKAFSEIGLPLLPSPPSAEPRIVSSFSCPKSGKDEQKGEMLRILLSSSANELELAFDFLPGF